MVVMSRAFLQRLGLSILIAAAPMSVAAQGGSSSAAATVSNDSLEEQIEYRLETSPVTKKYDIDVEAKSGVVTLTGEVATETQKAEAERLAHVEGVRRVESQIKIDKNADRSLSEKAQAGLSKSGEKINDAWITTKVKWLYVRDSDLRARDITVDTKDHVVTLKGRVKSEEDRARAIRLARQTDGVKRVVDRLMIERRS
jgi:osmotically-inducible protein OsmY